MQEDYRLDDDDDFPSLEPDDTDGSTQEVAGDEELPQVQEDPPRREPASPGEGSLIDTRMLQGLPLADDQPILERVHDDTPPPRRRLVSQTETEPDYRIKHD